MRETTEALAVGLDGLPVLLALAAQMQDERLFRAYLESLAVTAVRWEEVPAVAATASACLPAGDALRVHIDAYSAILTNPEGMLVKLGNRDGMAVIEPRYSYPPIRHQGKVKVWLGELVSQHSLPDQISDSLMRSAVLRSSAQTLQRCVVAAWRAGLLDGEGLAKLALDAKTGADKEEEPGQGVADLAEELDTKSVVALLPVGSLKTAIGMIVPVREFFKAEQVRQMQRVRSGLRLAAAGAACVGLAGAVVHTAAYLLAGTPVPSFVTLFLSFGLGLVVFNTVGERALARAHPSGETRLGEIPTGGPVSIVAVGLNASLHLALFSLGLFNGIGPLPFLSFLFFVYPMNYFVNLLWGARAGMRELVTRARVVKRRFDA
ncbi:MAG: GtrA family protein, partial [Propionibacteriaceae bacterium]|nr:GtrA family protein [Propionibacteriaceae bacterium]